LEQKQEFFFVTKWQKFVDKKKALLPIDCEAIWNFPQSIIKLAIYIVEKLMQFSKWKVIKFAYKKISKFVYK
jgi:hypothetical protein